MFYVWLFFVYMFFSFVFAGLNNLTTGGMPAVVVFVVSSVVSLFFISKAIEKIRQPHPHRKINLWLGWIGITIAILGTIVTLSEYGFSEPFDFEVAFTFLVLGVLTLAYGTSSETPVKVPEAPPKPEVPENELLKKVLYNLELTGYLPSAEANPEFEKALKNCSLYLSEINEKGFEIKKSLLSQINELLVYYQDLSDDRIQIKSTLESMKQIENVFLTVEKVLEKIYSDSMADKVNIVDADVKTLEMQLKLNGFTQNDFKIDK